MVAGNRFSPVIGLEIHLRLETQAKLFAPEAVTFDQQPNTNTSEVTLAEPGALPTVNKKAVDFSLLMALACGCRIAGKLVFDRKNYFYPDLPKGYQITQYREPLGTGGEIVLSSGKRIRLKSLQIEEDSAKSNQLDDSHSGLDFNRAGIPLLEIVTAPEIHDGAIASQAVYEIARIARYLGISHADPEKGSLRCDTNISLKNTDTGFIGNRTEIKNLNSYSLIKQALHYEIERQTQLYKDGNRVNPETLTFDPKSRKTIPMREKEVSESYRYTPEFDLNPIELSEKYIQTLKKSIPELPHEKINRLKKNYDLREDKAQFIADNYSRAVFFEKLAKYSGNQAAATWLAGPVQKILKEYKLSLKDISLTPDRLALLINLVKQGAVSRENAEAIVLPALINNSALDIEKYLKEKNLKIENRQEEIDEAIAKVLKEHPEETERLKDGEDKLAGFFIGQILKKIRVKTDPRTIRKRLFETLQNQNQ
ncbi:MAG: Asp-tRNA(Asn)/Glu-tRNA(Gln) amidotransferase subunit GatB [Bacteroidales bacterium]|nr:Asp-tRNA(Asn)/Glu-tRNA(Gln) amidotransferase subunit GatB [Bacteroidales bacterium]MCF8333160.1 Asp-tRNA(Asn)/Glu-tRNA(Gln) amidotransferase subunit GatB [Bacteroidales bacterium]